MYKVFTKSNCIYCDKAKALLKKLNISYEEYKLSTNMTGSDSEYTVTIDQMFEMIGKQVRLLIIWAADNDKQVTPAHAANGFFVYPVILSLIMPRYCIT